MVTTWEKWRRRHPDTLVLTTETGYRRDYDRDSYEAYYRSTRGMFGLFRGGPGEEAKERVAGVELDGVAKAYSVVLVRDAGPIRDRVGATELVVRLDPETDTLRVATVDGVPVEALVTYWMVWKGVYPDAVRYNEQ